MIGIVGFGAYIPRLRLSRRSVVQANAWYAPHLVARGEGTRSMANWDEDSVTMSVAAARDCLGAGNDRSGVRAVYLASCTPPFAERLNAAIVCEALTLDEDVEAIDLGGSQRAALGGLGMALSRARLGQGDVLLLAADQRNAQPGSAQELDYGDGAAALRVGDRNVIAEHLGGATRSVDFVDHFRRSGQEIDYYWEERWIRDEGIAKLVPECIRAALSDAGVEPAQVDCFILPTIFAGADAQVARQCGIRAEAVADSMRGSVGDTGAAHALLMLSRAMESATPGQIIVVAQFGSGVQSMIFRATDSIRTFRPRTGVALYLQHGVEEHSYTRFLSFKGQLQLERGMRGEQDRKTALSTAWRHRKAILGLVAGRCEATGAVHFPPSRLSYVQGDPRLDTQRPYKLAERRARVLSWSAEYLSSHRSPPNQYGQVDFEGGGRLLIEFTDVEKGGIESGIEVEMVFRIKDFDEKRGYTRYFWKATPVREPDAAVPVEE